MVQSTYQSKSLTINAFWLSVAKGIAFGGTILLPILLVRQMDQTAFGLYKQVFLAVNTMITVLPLGFSMSAFYFLPREPSRREQVIFNIVIFYLLVGSATGLALLFYPQLLAAIFNSPELSQYGREVGAIVLFWMISSFFEMVAVAQGEAYLAAIFVAISHLSRALLLLTAVFWAGTLQSLIHAALIHGILQTGALGFYLNSRFPRFWRRFDWGLMRAQLAYGMPLGFAGLLWIAQTDLHNYFVSYQFGAAVYAVYAIGCFQLPIVGIVRDSVGSLMISRVNKLRSEGDVREILFLTARMMRKMALLLLPIYFFLFVMRREVIIFLFTENYLESVPLFAVYLTLIPLSILSSGFGPIFRAYPEHFSFLIGVRVVLVALLVGALWLGTTRFGLMGAVAAVVGVNFIEQLILGSKVGRILGVSWQDGLLFNDVGKLFAAALAAAVVTAAVREAVLGAGLFVVLLWCGIAFGAAYVVMLLSFGILTNEERQIILRHLASTLKWMVRRKAQDPLQTLR